jgi:Tfp pilus assembly protein PilO
VTVKQAKLSPKALSLIVGAVGVLVLLAGLFVLVKPQHDKASALSAELATTQTQIVTARAQAKQKPEQKLRATNLFKLAKAMPDDLDMTGIVLQLQKTADDAGVDLNSIGPGTVAAATGYSVQPIALGLEGNFASLTNFLARLRRLVGVRHGSLDAAGRLFTVDSIQFSPGEDGFPKLSAKLNVAAYVYDPAAAGAAAAAPPTTTTEPSDGTDALAGGATP